MGLIAEQQAMVRLLIVTSIIGGETFLLQS